MPCAHALPGLGRERDMRATAILRIGDAHEHALLRQSFDPPLRRGGRNARQEADGGDRQPDAL